MKKLAVLRVVFAQQPGISIAMTNNIILPDNHYTITAANDVAEICAPLFKKYGLAQFIHARVYDDGTSWCLTSYADYHRHHFQKGFMLLPPIPAQYISKKFYYIPTENGPFNPIIQDQAYFQMSHTLFMIEQQKGYLDINILSAKLGNHSIINFYLNHMDVIEKFIFFFKEKAKKIIDKTKNTKMITPSSMLPAFNSNTASGEKLQLIKQFTPRKYYLSGEYGNVFLSKKEMTVFGAYGIGRSVKDIAENMHISPRTVETHIEHIKEKFSCNRKNQLLDLFLEFGFSSKSQDWFQ